MNKARTLYLILFLSVIFLGILSRKIAAIPLWIGDFLYAVMIYLLMRVAFFNKKTTFILILSLAICYGIEFLQLYQAPWIVELRKTIFGRYVLGQGFLWSDIAAYSGGILFVFLIEKIILKYTNYETRFRIKQ